MAQQTDTHTPTPRTHELPTGALAVSSHWVHGVHGAVTVPAEDRPLYRLLTEILSDTRVPDLMPAHLAAASEDLVDAKHNVEAVERGRVDLEGVGYGMSYAARARDAIADYRDRDPVRLAAVGCSGSKHDTDELLPAKDRYKSAYWSCKRQYGEVVADEYRILSAEYDVLDPNQEIPYYERTPGDLEGVPVDADGRLPSGDPVQTLLDEWALRVYEGLSRWLESAAGGVDPRDVTLEVLIGRPYKTPLQERGVFDRLSIPGDLTVSFPFQQVEQAQGGNGNQMGWMTDEVEAVTADAGGDQR